MYAQPYSSPYTHSMEYPRETHSLVVGYVLWLLGIFGAHRFYFGRPVTGAIWFFTGGLLLIGWIVDLFLMPSLKDRADATSVPGDYDHTIAWLLLLLLGVFGVHRFYQEKWITGILYLCTGGLFLVGVIYDVLTLNDQISDLNARR